MKKNLMINTIIAAVLIVLLFGKTVYYYQTGEEATITITGKEVVHSKEKSKYLIFTENETFENADLMFAGKFDSSDLHNKLKVDSTYKVKVMGWRWAFFSSYRNIVKIKK